VSARYDADAFRFERRYDAAARTLVVGADSATAERFTLRPHLLGGDNSRAGRDSYLNVALARGLPIDLTVHIGIGDGELDLGDLWLSRLMVVVAMSETTLNFRTPNAQPMDKLTIISALGGVTLHRLGNARAKKVELDVGVGGAEVDMRGEWTGDMTLDANVSVGGLELQVPRDAGVKVQVATKLGSLDAKGFTQKDGAWVSPNWDTATRHLTVVGGAKMAGVDVSWREP